jgi:hypothetical protein
MRKITEDRRAVVGFYSGAEAQDDTEDESFNKVSVNLSYSSRL